MIAPRSTTPEEPTSELQRRIEQRLRELIEPRRQDREFMERLRRRIREDKPILDRLRDSDTAPRSTTPEDAE